MTSSTTKNSQRIAATESSSDAQNIVMNTPEAFYQGNNIAAATGEDSFNDSGVFVECDEFYPPASGSNYKDFPLYAYVGDELPEIDHDMDGFFADIHAVHAKAISLYHQSNDSGIGFGDRNSTSQVPALGNESQFSSSVEAIAGTCINLTVPQASKDGGVHSQSANIPASPPISEDAAAGSPLLTWAGTRHRHERIACLLSQPQSRQESKT